MPKYRKKPIVIDATQWFKNGDHPKDCSEQLSLTSMVNDKRLLFNEGKIVRYYRNPDIEGQAPCTHCGDIFHNHGWIDTLEGGHRVCPGDWIIRSIKGEFYPCKPDIFEATYEEVID